MLANKNQKGLKKRSTGPEKKTRKGLNSLSCFQAHEKEVHPDLNSLSNFQAREKKTRKGLTRSLVFKLMKKRSTGPQLALTFPGS